MRRLGLALFFVLGLALAGGLSGTVLADTNPSPTTSTATTTTIATTTTTTAPAEQVLPQGVTIEGVEVGGLTPTAAYLALQTWAKEPLRISVGKTRLAVPRDRLGAVVYLWGAISRARAVGPGTDVDVAVAVRGGDVRAYVAELAERYDRPAVDATLRLRKLKPAIVGDVPGQRLRRTAAVAALVAALKANETRRVSLPLQVLKPKVRRAGFGPVIVIRRGSNRLDLYDGERLKREFTVATGQRIYPTPLGRFEIVAMWKNPWWYPPASPWAAGEDPVPPGPGNPLGTRWMGISSPGVGIHGTPDAASLGYSASHGCVRMAIPQAEWLFDHVEVGTPVYIVAA